MQTATIAKTATIARQYDDVIAPAYDRDPQEVLGRSLSKAAAQLASRGVLEDDGPLSVLELGVGTGLFLAMLRERTARSVRPFGIDVSAKMIDVARRRIPDLTAEVDDAANLDRRFPGESFGLVCTHYVTGFVPIRTLAPKIHDRLEPGGLWSFVGGTQGGFPALQKRADSPFLKWVLGGGGVDVNAIETAPADRAEIVAAMEAAGFDVIECESFAPQLAFADFDEFLAFAYDGGWLTPFIESMGLHRSRPLTRKVLNALYFPVRDQHRIEIVTALRPET